MTKQMIFLQNTYSAEYAGREWPRGQWLKALEKSQTGQMLQNLTNDLGCVWNTTPIAGAMASSKLAPDRDYVRRMVILAEPRVIVACGRQAIEEIRSVWDGPRLELPHPTCRWLRKDLYREGKRLLDLMVRGKMDFKARVWEKRGQPFRVEVLQQ
jgi:hypothetical protein